MAKDWSHEQLLVGCSGSHVNVWSPFDQGVNGLVYEATQESVINTVRWSPNRRALAYCDAAGTVHIASNGQVFPNTMATFEGGITCVRFSTDGKLLFISSKAVVHVLDLRSQAAELTFSDHTTAVTTFCIDVSDGIMASSSLDGTVMMHSLKERRLLGQLCGPDGSPKRVLAIATREGHATVVASSSKGIAVMNVVPGGGGGLNQAMLPSMHTGAVTGLAFSGATSMISCGEDGNVLLWDMRTQRVTARCSLAAPLTCLAVRDVDGKVAVGTSDGTVHVVDFRMPEPQTSLQVGRFRGLPGPVTDLHWQPLARSHSASSATAAALQASAPAAAGSTLGPVTQAPLAGVSVRANAGVDATSAGLRRSPGTPLTQAVAGLGSNITSPVPSPSQPEPLRDATNLQPSNHYGAPMPKQASDQSLISAGGKAFPPAASTWINDSSLSPLSVPAHGMPAGALAAPGRQATGHPGTSFRAESVTSEYPPASGAPSSSVRGSDLGGAHGRGTASEDQDMGGEGPNGWASGPSGYTAAAVAGAAALRGGAVPDSAAHLVGARDDVQSMVEAAMSLVRQDIRNLHIEVLRQAHLQQAELHQMLGKVLSNQEGLQSKIAALEKRVEQLATRRHGAALGIF